MSEHTLTITKHLPAAPEVVFDAWTTPEDMTNWFGPSMVPVSVPKLELRVGGEYRVDMHGEGKDYIHTGKYLEIDRPNKLVFSWFLQGGQENETVVTLDLKAEGGGTLLTLTHERFSTAESRDGHKKGWTEIVERLEDVLGAQANTGS